MPASLRCEDCHTTSEVSLVNDGIDLEWRCPNCGAHHQQPIHDIRAHQYPGMLEAQHIERPPAPPARKTRKRAAKK